MVIVPTRELAIQVANEYEKLQLFEGEFSILSIYGGTPIYKHKKALRFGVDVVVGTPGRVIDLSKRGDLKYDNLQAMILDEADEMLNMGFQEDIECIYENIDEQGQHKVQNLLFSATMPPWVLEIAENFMAKGYEFLDLLKDVVLKTPTTVEHLAIKCPFNSRLDIMADVV